MAKYLSDVAVGESVRILINGVELDFLVVHQGKPDDSYGGYADGTWVLLKDIYEFRTWGDMAVGNTYGASTVHAWLNGDFLGMIGGGIAPYVKEVLLPCYADGAVSGVSARVFLLSHTEVGGSAWAYAPREGYPLDYFKGASDAVRQAHYDGSTEDWWLRSPYLDGTGQMAIRVKASGSANSNIHLIASIGIRPAMVLPSGLGVDGEGLVIPSVMADLPYVTDRTAADVRVRNAKGTYNYTDLNRVGRNVGILAELMRKQGYDVRTTVLRDDWAENELLHGSEVEPYLNAVARLWRLGALDVILLPQSMARLDYSGANNIERFMEWTHGALQRSEAAWVYSDEIYSDEI